MKNTLRLKRAISVIIMIMILGISNISNAYSVGAALSSGDKLVAGKNVTVTLSLSSIDAGEGLSSITVDKINYDTNVFETISASSFAGNNGWNPTYSTKSQGLTLTNNTHVTANGAAVTLTLKVKEGVTAKSSIIKFEGIVASAGLTTGDINVGTKTLTVNADSEANGGSENTPSTDTSTPSTTTKANTTNNTSGKVTTAKKANISNLPKAGLETGMVFVLVAGLVVGIVFYAKYKNIKKYDK